MIGRCSVGLAGGAAAIALVSGAVAAYADGEPVVIVTTAAASGVAAGVLCAALLHRYFYGPITRLADAARRLATGEISAAAAQGDLAPIGDVAEAFSDAIERLRGEIEALAAEREKASAALAAMTEGIVIVDGSLRVERINEAAERLLRLSPGIGAGSTLAAVVRDHELQQVLLAALEEGRPQTATIQYAPLRPRGTRPLDEARDEARVITATGIPLRLAGRADGTAGVLVLKDVTEIRRTETVRREFVGNVSHELRTPLASLKALVETLEEGALDDPPAAREFLAQMHVEVDSLTQLVQELLELSRIESGQAPVRAEAVSASDLVSTVARRLKRQAERLDVALTYDVPDELPPVWADPALIERVLINLLHNALKFTDRGGTVTLDAAEVPEGVRFSVVDTGIGIAPDEVDRIFERFYKTDKSRASGGTGLGLAIAKHIVQAHGGRIWAESEGEGRGSAFRFVVPRAETGEAQGNGALADVQREMPPLPESTAARGP